MDLHAENLSRNVSEYATPSFLPMVGMKSMKSSVLVPGSSKPTETGLKIPNPGGVNRLDWANGPSRRPEKDILRKFSGSKSRVHGQRNPVHSDPTAQTYEHKRGRGRVRDKVERERHRDELSRLRREDSLRRKLEIQYTKDRAEREAEEDRIRLSEERLKREWESKLEREENDREKRIIEEDRASITTREQRRKGATKKSLFCPFADCKRSSGAGFTRKENLAEHMRREHRRTSMSADMHGLVIRHDTVTQGSPPPPANFRFAHYDPLPPRQAYPLQSPPFPPTPPVGFTLPSGFRLPSPEPSYRPPADSFQAPPPPAYRPLGTDEYFAEDEFRQQSPGLEQIFVAAAPTPSPPPQVTKVLHPLVSSPSPSSWRQRKADQRKARPTQGDFVLMREIAPNQPKIAQHARKQALDPNLGEYSPNNGEEIQDQSSNISQQRMSRAAARIQLSPLSNNELNGTSQQASASAATLAAGGGFTAVNTGGFRAVNMAPPGRESSRSRSISPWTVPPTITMKARGRMDRTYKGERQKADMSRASRKKVIKKGSFVLKYTLSADDTQNEVSRNRKQFIALGRASQ
jgi:hypothetical protein